MSAGRLLPRRKLPRLSAGLGQIPEKDGNTMKNARHSKILELIGQHSIDKQEELLAHFTHALVTTLRIDINLLNRLRIQLQTSGDSMKARQHNGTGLGANPRRAAPFRAVGSFAAEIFAAAAADAP